MDPDDTLPKAERSASICVDEAMCIGYLMFNLMNGVFENEGPVVTLTGLMSTARACNNLAYCATVARIADHHSAVETHIQDVLCSAGGSKSLIRHLLATGSTLNRVRNTTVFKLRNKRRRVYFSSANSKLFISAHGATHFQYDATNSVVSNGARLLTLVNMLKLPSQKNQTALGLATSPD
jgi:hypothetical protein